MWIDAQAAHLRSKPCQSFIALIDEASRSNVISFPTDVPGPPAGSQECGNAGVQRLWMVAAALNFGAWPLQAPDTGHYAGGAALKQRNCVE